MTETMRSENGRREATIENGGGCLRGYSVVMFEKRRLGSSSRTRNVPTKAEARELARKWCRR